MPNQFMNAGRAAFAQAGINWNSDTISAVLVDSTYTFSASHSVLSDISAPARISTTNLASKTSTNGVLDAATPILWASVTSPNNIVGVYLYKNTGDASTSTLIKWIDGLVDIVIAATTSSSTSVPVDPLVAQIPNDAVLTRISGTGSSSITLSGSGGGAENARVLTANSAVSCVVGDVYRTAAASAGLPITFNPNGGAVTLAIDSVDKIGQI